MNFPLKGIIPPIVTPLIDNLTLDVQGLEKLIEHYIAGGVHGLFILGTTGEAQSLGYKLRKEFIKRTCDLVGHRIPVLVGITDTSLEGSLEIADYSHKVGADAVVVAPPYYIPITQSELTDYFESLFPRLALPVFIYNMPGCTKLHMTIKTVKTAKDLGAVGIKDSSGDMLYLSTLIEEFKGSPEFSILTGTELFIPETIMQGGHGAIAGGANLFPRFFVEFYEASLARDYKKIAVYRTQSLNLYNTIYSVGKSGSRYTRGIKCTLATMGLCNDFVASPLRKMEGEELQKIEEYMKELSDAKVYR
jgi:4-hydroxy-tetrahydrodipicolinate synthase